MRFETCGAGRKATLAAVLAAILATALLAYASFVEPRRLSVTRIQISRGSLARVLAGRKVAILADLHFGAAGEPTATAALIRLEAIRPDLILLGGDYVQWGSRGPAYDRAIEFLSRLNAPLGVYAVLGDADASFSRKSCEFCHEPGGGAPTKRHGVVFLRNESRMLELPRGRLRIAGLDAIPPRPMAARLRGLLTSAAPTILLAHSSAAYKEIDSAAEVLTVSGDTHGGQIRLPQWFWRLGRFKPDPEHMHGYFRNGSKSLVVTRGVGTSRLRFRLGAPPEIIVLDFAGEPQ